MGLVCCSEKISIQNMSTEALLSTTPLHFDATEGIVVKVYDGDTITVVAKPSALNRPCQFSIRLYGIDCPEMRGSSPEEKEIAVKAKERLIDLFSLSDRPIVKLSNWKKDKYGRVVASVSYNNCDLTQMLLAERLGVVYDGGKKKCPVSWKRYHESGSWN